jgi:hypothetical protein
MNERKKPQPQPETCPECGEVILGAATHWPGFCRIYCNTGRARVGLCVIPGNKGYKR